MRAKIDCLAYQALCAERHLRRVSNAEYLAFLRCEVWPRLSEEQQALYEKLLGGDRSRYVGVIDFDRVTTDDHQVRYRAYKTRLESLAIKCLDDLLAQAEVPARRIRLVITNHTVAGICPPLSSLVANRLGLPPSVQALDLAFMGCAAAVYGCELAWRLLQPGEVAVVLSAELTSAATNLNGSPEATAVLHTAGTKVLRGLQQYLGLSDRKVGHNFDCFRKYGNTSSASIYYSLAELERSAGLKRGNRLLFLAYGSGFLTKCMYGVVP
jgi:predicted naringenin-chalcone synthase